MSNYASVKQSVHLCVKRATVLPSRIMLIEARTTLLESYTRRTTSAPWPCSFDAFRADTIARIEMLLGRRVQQAN